MAGYGTAHKKQARPVLLDAPKAYSVRVSGLALRELEAFAGAGLAGLFPLDFAGVAGEKTGLAQGRA